MLQVFIHIKNLMLDLMTLSQVMYFSKIYPLLSKAFNVIFSMMS